MAEKRRINLNKIVNKIKGAVAKVDYSSTFATALYLIFAKQIGV